MSQKKYLFTHLKFERERKKEREKTLQNSFPVSHRPFNQLPEHRNVRPAPSTEGIPIRTSLVHLAAGFHAYRFAENRFKSTERQDLAKAKKDIDHNRRNFITVSNDGALPVYQWYIICPCFRCCWNDSKHYSYHGKHWYLKHLRVTEQILGYFSFSLAFLTIFYIKCG